MNIPMTLLIEFLVLLTAVGGIIVPMWMNFRNKVQSLEVKTNVLENDLKHHQMDDARDSKRWDEVFKRLGSLETLVARIETKMEHE